MTGPASCYYPHHPHRPPPPPPAPHTRTHHPPGLTQDAHHRQLQQHQRETNLVEDSRPGLREGRRAAAAWEGRHGVQACACVHGAAAQPQSGRRQDQASHRHTCPPLWYRSCLTSASDGMQGHTGSSGGWQRGAAVAARKPPCRCPAAPALLPPAILPSQSHWDSPTDNHWALTQQLVLPHQEGHQKVEQGHGCYDGAWGQRRRQGTGWVRTGC